MKSMFGKVIEKPGFYWKRIPEKGNKFEPAVVQVWEGSIGWYEREGFKHKVNETAEYFGPIELPEEWKNGKE